MTESPLVIIVMDLIIEKYERNKTRRKDFKEDLQPNKETRKGGNKRDRNNKTIKRNNKTKRVKKGNTNSKAKTTVKQRTKIRNRKK